jgi:branched-chain amino acid transport system substrate-binding protein
LLAVVALALLPAVIAACGSGSGTASTGTSSTTARVPSRGNVDGTLALGQLAPLTGNLVSISNSLTVPVQLAVGDVNAAGGVNGKPVTLTVADDGGGGNPNMASSSISSLLDAKKVDAIIGPTATGTALDLFNTIRTKRALTCSGSNSAEELSVADSGGYYFRTAPPDRLQAIALARLLAAEGKRKPVIVARSDAYGDAFIVPLERELRRLGANPLGSVIRYNPAAKSVAWVGSRVASRHPDSVVTISLTDDGAAVVNALAAAGVGPNQLPVYAPDGMQSTTFHTKVNPANPAAVLGIRGTAPAAAPAGPETLFTAALRKAGVSPIFSAHYYDCTILTALAALQAHSDDPAKMKQVFAKSLHGATDCATFAACKQDLAAGKTIHYRGVSSAFDQWARGEPGEGTYDGWTYDGSGNVVTGAPGYQIHVP